jgi:hypothetical protein
MPDGGGGPVPAPDNGGVPDLRMEETLRRGLAAAVGPVQPGADGLDRIRARIAGRPPRPWLVAVAADAVGTARHWVWRGHWDWSWTGAVPAAVGPALPRLRRLPRPGELLRPASARSAGRAQPANVGWLRPAGVLAVIAVIASVSFGVGPFRQAIIQASSTVLSGGPSQPAGGAGTDGDGTQNGSGNGLPGASESPTGPGGRGGRVGATSSRGATASPTATASCAPTVTTAVTNAVASEAPTTAAAASGAAAARRLTAELTADLSPTATPSATPSPTASCAKPSPSGTPTPSTSAGSPATSATPTTGATSPTPTDSPTPTPTTTTPTPTPTPTDTGSPTDSPTDSGDSGTGGTGGDVATGPTQPGS